MNKKTKLLTVMLCISMLFVSTVFALPEIDLSPNFISDMDYSVNKVGPDYSYNCLAYSMGVDDEWIWPWGNQVDTPVLYNDVKHFMEDNGYTNATYNSSSNKICVYYGVGSGYIEHFSKILENGSSWTNGRTKSKHGGGHLVTIGTYSSKGHDPYYSSNSSQNATSQLYGALVGKFK